NQRYAAQLREAIMKSGMRGQITLAGQLSDQELRNLYARSDIFVMPSLFEGYGMALTEAIARGLPIVCTTGGAISETAPDAAALKVPPGDADALAAAIQDLIVDRDLRHRLSEEAWNASRNLPTWEACAEKVAGVLKTVAEARR
ncbi:MAG: glycosyltransferase family 4 protein, partial [Hyphomicrobiaceae bacterium]